jgi:hypothetical protein
MGLFAGFILSIALLLCDADKTVPFEENTQLMESRYKALGGEVDPQTILPEHKIAFRAAMQTALSGGSPGDCTPLDWLHTTAPSVWHFGKEKIVYHWDEAAGAVPLKV